MRRGTYYDISENMPPPEGYDGSPNDLLYEDSTGIAIYDLFVGSSIFLTDDQAVRLYLTMDYLVKNNQDWMEILRCASKSGCYGVTELNYEETEKLRKAAMNHE